MPGWATLIRCAASMPLSVMSGRHPDVGHDHIGRQPAHSVLEFLRATHRCDDLDLTAVLQDAAGAFAHEVVVLGDRYPQPFNHRTPSAAR